MKTNTNTTNPIIAAAIKTAAKAKDNASRAKLYYAAKAELAKDTAAQTELFSALKDVWGTKDGWCGKDAWAAYGKPIEDAARKARKQANASADAEAPVKSCKQDKLGFLRDKDGSLVGHADEALDAQVQALLKAAEGWAEVQRVKAEEAAKAKAEADAKAQAKADKRKGTSKKASGLDDDIKAYIAAAVAAGVAEALAAQKSASKKSASKKASK